MQRCHMNKIHASVSYCEPAQAANSLPGGATRWKYSLVYLLVIVYCIIVTVYSFEMVKS